jgi:uncharacterized protein YbjQ (UPF0145 family)
MSSRYQAAILSASFNGLKAPDAPTIGTATAGAGSASVTFTAPANVGGSAITSYTVISSPGSIIGTGASSPITVSGLTNGTAYTFTVVATNAYGTGPASAASNSVTPAVNYIEDVFSTWLYTGNGTTNVITNNIDLSTKSGMVWMKSRSDAFYHGVYDTVRGTGTSKSLYTNTNEAQGYNSTNQNLTAFNADGFTLGATSSTNAINGSGGSMCSWTFREQANFFDIVTWSGNDVSGREIAHSLGSTPGMVVIKSLVTDDWVVWHRSLTSGNYIVLNTTAAQTTSAAVNRFGNGTTTVDPTATVFTVGNNGTVNQSGNNYVAYLFAHNAGGFGLSGTDNVISCGSFSTSAGAATVTLGYEPQYILWKRIDATQNWNVYDTMRGWAQKQVAQLYPNLTQIEDMYLGSEYFFPTATGFQLNSSFGLAGTYIYVAIRRGPMKVPTVGTSVFTPVTRTGTSAVGTSVSGFATDSYWIQRRNGTGYNQNFDRLRGALMSLQRYNNATENDNADTALAFPNNGVSIGADSSAWAFNTSGETYIDYHFQRAPGFFDEICFTVSGSVPRAHNLGVTPELVIYKTRGSADSWWVCANVNGVGQLNNASAWALTGLGNGLTAVAQATSTTISNLNGVLLSSTNTVVAYLFATVAGVSKVGSYTGTGALQTVNCAFTTGARFVLIKRTDSTGDWWTYDSARGITSGNDPYLYVNTTDAEVTGTNYVDTTGVGFQVTAAAPAGLNAVGGTYIFLAIA